MNNKDKILWQKATIAIAPFWKAILIEAITQQLECSWLEPKVVDDLLSYSETGISLNIEIKWDPKYRGKPWVSVHVNLAQYGTVYMHRKKTTGFLRQMNSCLQYLLQDLIPSELILRNAQLRIPAIYAPTDEQLTKGIAHLEKTLKKSKYKLSETASKRYVLASLMDKLEQQVLDEWANIVATLGSDSQVDIIITGQKVTVQGMGNATGPWSNRTYLRQDVWFHKIDEHRGCEQTKIFDEKIRGYICKIAKQLNLNKLFEENPEIAWRWSCLSRTITAPSFHQIASAKSKAIKKASASRGSSSTKRSKKAKALKSSQGSCSLIPENQEKASKREDLPLHKNCMDVKQDAQQLVLSS
jgi:hypothetical protein